MKQTPSFLFVSPVSLFDNKVEYAVSDDEILIHLPPGVPVLEVVQTPYVRYQEVVPPLYVFGHPPVSDDSDSVPLACFKRILDILN